MSKQRSDPSKTKGIHRVNTNLKIISKAVENLQHGNNSTDRGIGLLLFSATLIRRLHNIRLVDLQISEFKTLAQRTTKNCILLMLAVLIEPNCTRSRAIKQFGLNYPVSSIIISQFIEAGYIRETIGKSAYKQPFGNIFHKDEKQLELTAKGYDKIDFIFSLLIDKRLL